MKHKIKSLAESTPVAWGTIAEKIDENFEELESTIGEGGDSGTAKSSISILFVGNSLTQDGIAYLPYMLKNYYPEVDFKLYMWYIGGKTLADHYSAFTSGGKAEIFSVAENNESWTNFSKSKTMASVLSTYKFDIVCMQEYFNYKTKYTEATDWNHCRDYIVNNYKGGNALEFISLFHAPLRKDGYDVHEVFKRTEEGNALILQTTISEDIIPNGIAVYRALDTDLNTLGDLGQLSPDGTHTQEGLPCLLQTYVTLCWLFDRLGINKSVYGHPMRINTTIYNKISVPGANLGSGVIQGTDAQNLLAQEVAIKAYKEGKQFLVRNLYPFEWSAGGGGGTLIQCTFSITTNVNDAVIKINGVEQSSIVVIAGSVVNWEVSKDGYETQSGSETVNSDITKNVELAPIISVTSISAVFTQGQRTIFDEDDINDLKKNLVVTANYADGTSEVTEDYTLSGTLTGGTSTITVSFGGKDTSFDVEVTAVVIPEGYERYGYIQSKSNSRGSTQDLSKFIYLSPYEDYNALSMMLTIGRKPNVSLDGAGILGSRLASGSNYPYVGVYWQSEGGLWGSLRHKRYNCSVLADDTFAKIEVNNPETSPYYIKVNGGEEKAVEWTESSVIPTPMSLFNNVPANSTSKLYVNSSARIGDLIFRKVNGECVGYYTPVVYDGKIGMYDQISKTFYTAVTASAVTISNSACLYSVGNW